jgi:hypothetical protein
MQERLSDMTLAEFMQQHGNASTNDALGGESREVIVEVLGAETIDDIARLSPYDHLTLSFDGEQQTVVDEDDLAEVVHFVAGFVARDRLVRE